MKVTQQGPLSKRKVGPGALNLVPMIDLFSMIIIFLIITATFDQMAQIQINMGSEEQAQKVIREPVKEVEAVLKITLSDNRLELYNAGESTFVDKVADADFKWIEVEDFLKDARQDHPNKRDIVLFSDDNVEYGSLVRVMDHCLAEDFRELVVSGAN